MSFEAKRLRVQLPCGDVSAYDADAPPMQVVPATFCPMPSKIPTAVIEILACGSGTADDVDPDTLLVSPDRLAGLRRQLEARLAMVVEAEQAVAAATMSDK